MKLSRFCKPKVNLAGALSKAKQDKSDADKKESLVVPPPILTPTKLIDLNQKAPLSPSKKIDSNIVPAQVVNTEQSENRIEPPLDEPIKARINCNIEIIDLPQELEEEVPVSDSQLPSCDIDEAPRVRLFEEKKREIIRRVPYKSNIKTDQPLDKSTVLLKDLIHWIPSHNPPPKYRQKREETEKNKPTDQPEPTPISNPTMKCPKDEDILQEVEDSESESPPPGAVPQLKLDSEGNIILDESSLLIKSELPDFKKLNFLEEDASDLTITCRSFRNSKGRSRRWTEKEVIHFYKALSTIGTDFTSMSNMFKDRDREELKKKFKREEKKNPHLIDRALKSRRSYDLSMFNMSSSEEEEKPIVKPARKRKLKTQQKATGKKRSGNLYNDSEDEDESCSKKTRISERETVMRRIEESIESVLAKISDGVDSPMPISNNIQQRKLMLELSMKHNVTTCSQNGVPLCYDDNKNRARNDLIL